MDMLSFLRKALGNWLFVRLKLNKTAETFKELRKIPFFSWSLFSVFLFGGIVIASGFLPAESKMAANISLINSEQEIQDSSDSDLFLNAGEHNWLNVPEFLMIGNSSLAAFAPTLNTSPQLLGMWLAEGDPASRQEIIEYIVEEKDTLSSIAERFEVSANTIVWANNLKGLSVKPGQKLLILPVSGVMHVVQSGDTVNKIAGRYKGDSEKIASFNYLSEGEKLLEGEVLIVPGGQIVKAAAPSQPKAVSSLSTNNFNGQSHAFPFGQCTWWVAQKRAIPAWGNAKDWIKNAMAAGYQTCLGSSCVPKVGAVIQTSGNRIYGHVAYVEKVEEDKIVISEMNYIGWGKMNYRTILIGSPQIKGYIY